MVSTQHSALSTQHSALSTQHSALSTFNKFFRRFFSALLIIALPSALAAPIYYNPWDRVQVTSAEQTCLGTINYFKNNPPNTYIDWSFVRSEFGQDFDSRVIGANGNYFSGSCIMTHTNPQVGTGTFHMEFSVACLTGYIVVKKESNTATCISDGLNLTLTPAPNQKDPRPKGTEGKDPKSSTYELIAKVMEGSTPKAGVEVKFAVEVEANSGGHDHHDASRPKGLVNGKLTASGVTEANGEIKVTFQASEFSGTHVVAAVCDSCTNKSVTKNVDVKVPDLIELTADTAKPPRFTFVGDDTSHRSNHWYTADSVNVLQKVIDAMILSGWGTVGVNDSSLKWGGRFDIYDDWAGPHSGHRTGNEVDLRIIDRGPAQIKKTYDKLCSKTESSLDAKTLWHKDDAYGKHFHIYLDGNGMVSAAERGKCCASYLTKTNADGTPILDVKTGKPITKPVNKCEEITPR